MIIICGDRYSGPTHAFMNSAESAAFNDAVYHIQWSTYQTNIAVRATLLVASFRHDYRSLLLRSIIIPPWENFKF